MSFNPAAGFAGRRVPPWLQRFAAAPLPALHDLLMGCAALGHLDAAEPAEILLDWLRLLPDDFAAAVDDALAAWVDAYWGDSLPQGSAGHAALTAEAWIRACDLIALSPALTKAAAALRRHFLLQPRFLDSLGEGRARDPQSRAWQALARHQSDRSLLPHWWNLCRLPSDQPWRRGACGVDGLLFLPAKNPQRAGGFPQEAAEGLACLGAALWQRQQDGWLQAETAREEWLGVAQLAELTAPFADRWLDFWRTAQAEPRCQAWSAWLRSLHGNLGQAKPRPAARAADPSWPKRAKDLARRIEAGDDAAIQEADVLLQEQQRYADGNGDAEPYARSAVMFSAAARRLGRLEQALAWAEAARVLAPWNAHAWNNVTVCLNRLHRPEALPMAMETAQRFPNDAVAATGLAEVLKAQGRLEEAEAQYRLTLARFPDNAVAGNGLAEVLKAQDKLEEAEAQYRSTLARFPNDAVAGTGLAEVLKAQGRLEEAEAQYRLTLARFPNDAVAGTGLAEVLKAQGRLEEAEAQYRLNWSRFPNDAVAGTGLAEVLAMQDKLEDAEAQYRQTLARFPRDVVTNSGLAKVLARRHKFEEAQTHYRRTLALDPHNAIARRGLEELEKHVDQLKQQTAACRLAVQAAPDDADAVYALAQVLYRRREYNEALDWVERALQIDPGHAAASALSAKLPDRQAQQEQSTPPAGIDVPLAPETPLVDAAVSPVDHSTGETTTLPGAAPLLSQTDLQILTADAYLIRCWRRATGQNAPYQLPGHMQKRAETLLQRLLTLDGDALAVSEAGLLEISAGDSGLALELLRQAVQRFPGSSRVRYALARAERAVDGPASVPQWKRMARQDARLQPLSLLGESRARLADAAPDDATADILGRLGYCLQPHLHPLEGVAVAESDVAAARAAFAEPKDSFMDWWAREVHAHLFGARLVSDADHLPAWESLIANARREALDGLEEDFLGRYAAA